MFSRRKSTDKMSVNPIRFSVILGLLAVWQVPDSASQFIRNVPRTGSVSKARSTAYEREIDYGPVEVSRGVANSRTVTKSNGGFRNGGVTSVSKSKAISRELELGPLDIGSTLTRSQTKTNGAVSRSVAHDLNIGNLNIGTSLSRDNLANGIGLQRSADGGLKFGLGPLSIDLSRNNQPDTNAYTQAQAQAQGRNARARANSNTHTQAQQYGNVGVTNTFSKSNAVSRTRHGQTSASTNGLVGVPVYGHGIRVRRTPSAQASAPFKAATSNHRVRRTPSSQVTYIRPKRRAQFIPFVYPEDGRLERPGIGSQPKIQNANAQGIANNKNKHYEQQAGANTQTNQEINAKGITQNNGASSIGSNLATDGQRGQVSSANAAQMNSVAKDGSQSSNNAQSQALNFAANKQQASSANAGTNHIIKENGRRVESNSGSQATNNNQFGASSNIANTNAAVFQEGDTRGSRADSSGQSIIQGNNGDNAAANTGSSVTSTMGADGSISNSATSNASAVSQGGKSANAVATASSNSGAGGGTAFTNAQGSVGGRFNGFDASASSGASGNIHGAQGFAIGETGKRRAWRRRQLNPTIKQQSGKLDIGRENGKSLESTASNWSQNRSVQYDNSSTEQFGVIDENERHGRTFSLIADFINSLTPRCVYPCTNEAFERQQCCETVVIVPQPPPIPPIPPMPPIPLPPPIRPLPPIACCPQYPFQPPPILPPPQRPFPPPPQSLPHPPPIVVIPTPTMSYPLLASQCCTSCPTYGYYGPPPCTRFNQPRNGPGRVTQYVPPYG